MKKTLTIIGAFLLITAMFLTLAACEQAHITGIEYLSGIKSYYYKNDVINPTKVKIKVLYSDNTQQEIFLTAENFSSLDTSEFGEHTVVITYKEFTANVTYTVREIDYKIYAIEEPAFVTAYKNNIREQDNKRTEFTDRERGYKVGCENAFVFMPKALALNKNDEFVNIDSFPIAYTLSVKKGNEFVELSGEELKNTVTVNTDKGEFLFSEDAVGNDYLLSVRPYLIEDDQKEEDVTKSFEFTVIKGYNVYDAMDLAVIDNSGREEWTKFREENNLPQQPAVSAVILHGDVAITEKNFPSQYVFDETEVKESDSDYKLALGSLKDWTDIYKRYLNEDEKFSVIGNYFSVDASEIPLVVRTDHRVVPVGPDGEITEVIISHSQLFVFENAVGVEEKASEEPRVTIENAFLIGNSNRSEDAMLSGGLIFSKIKIMEGACINCISNGWYISYFPETMTITKFTIEDCKAYDSFNCILYSWGARVSIKNSELIGAGGPVIIADHHDEDSATGAGGYISGIDVDGNSVLESYVAGSEGWFQQFNATSAATAIKQLSSQVFAQYGYTFTKVENTIEKFNLIAIYKSGSANGVTATPIRGYFNREASTDHVAHFMNFEDPTTAVILNNLKGTGAPLFQSNGAYCFFNGSALINPLDMQPVTPAFPLFRGDYINLFYASAGSSGYMGLVFGGLQAVAA